MEKVTSVKVRMYRHGFGDCFLLRFFSKDEKLQFNILIDCGLKLNDKVETAPMKDVVDDIKRLTKKPNSDKSRLDVLVATHEHWDHVSGFHPKYKFFDDLDIDKLWLAWTEDPKDSVAKTINNRLRQGVHGLQLAASLLENESTDEQVLQGMYFSKDILEARRSFRESLKDIMGFYGAAPSEGKSGIVYNPNGSNSADTQTALEHLISLSNKTAGIEYLRPGTLLQHFLPPGIRVYVLGPPKNKLINKSNPSGGKNHETYLGLGEDGFLGFIDGVFAAYGNDRTKQAFGAPFVNQPSISKEKALGHSYYKRYFESDSSWRGIDKSWLDVTGSFALQLDKAVNNTSLVLAIEFEDSGKVLLFPGDAQVGSWLSWHDLEWDVVKGETKRKVTTTDLLANTVLYKVSHHGSHNATVKELGLELMTHPDLMAFVPEKNDSYRGIPYDKLMERLQQQCKGRVIVSADTNFPADNIQKQKPPSLSASEWEELNRKLEITELFVEYTITAEK